MKKNYSQKYLLISIFFMFLLYSININAQTFNNADDLVDAVNSSTDGGTFIVADGTYKDFEATFQNIASELNQ